MHTCLKQVTRVYGCSFHLCDTTYPYHYPLSSSHFQNSALCELGPRSPVGLHSSYFYHDKQKKQLLIAWRVLLRMTL